MLGDAADGVLLDEFKVARFENTKHGFTNFLLGGELVFEFLPDADDFGNRALKVRGKGLTAVHVDHELVKLHQLLGRLAFKGVELTRRR